MSIRNRVVSESRTYDAIFDPVFTSGSTDPKTSSFKRAKGSTLAAMSFDNRVSAMSNDECVSGHNRFKYFRRPVMPRTSAVNLNVLLAPSSINLTASEAINDMDTITPMRDAEMQTMYRDSEAQTVPYAPAYTLRPGDHPNILLMGNLTVGNGLPIGNKEVAAIEFAIQRRELEMSMPPFTDEASLCLRKRLMEAQEMREIKMRENEIDSQREIRMERLERALADREEVSEFAAAQRVESLRAKLMDEREKKLQELRNSRIKVLRRLAQARTKVDNTLSDRTAGRDIISEYFDKGSSIYAPRVRDGQHSAVDNERLDVTTRTANLSSLNNVQSLEATIPLILGSDSVATKSSLNGTDAARGSAADPRATSSTLRRERNAKKDVETMSQILQRRRKSGGGGGLSDRSKIRAVISMPGEGERKLSSSAAAPVRVRQRPPTPDLTRNRDEYTMEQEEEYIAAVMLMQRLIRGRSAQNDAFEGRFRRAALIDELREAEMSESDAAEEADQMRKMRMDRIRDSSVDAAVGLVASTLMSLYSREYKTVNASKTLGL